MKTSIIRVDPLTPDPAVLAHAAAVLTRGGLVALPTETVYGLAARADDPGAVARIFEAKGRPAYNPLIVHVSEESTARVLAAVWPAVASRLTRAFWPGPLTVVVPRDRARVPDPVCAGGDTVAIRCPAHPVAAALLRTVPFGIAAPSANRFQSLSPTTAEHVLHGLAGRIDLVLDGGPCAWGIESTVVDVSVSPPTLLRPGAVSREALEAVLGPVALGTEGPQGVRRSPGMDRKHYAPRARVQLLPRDALHEALRTAGHRTALLTWRAATWEALRWPLGALLPGDPVGYAARLYAVLHELDARGCDGVVVEELPMVAAWEAVRDRLVRACG